MPESGHSENETTSDSRAEENARFVNIKIYRQILYFTFIQSAPYIVLNVNPISPRYHLSQSTLPYVTLVLITSFEIGHRPGWVHSENEATSEEIEEN